MSRIRHTNRVSGNARGPTARTRVPVAQAKLISLIEGVLDAAQAPIVQRMATSDLSFRHDIKVLNDLVRALRADVDQLKQGGADYH